MDCKILKKTLFISILAISLFYTGEVRAAKKCTTTYTSKPAIEKTKCKITIDKIKQNANFYEFKLDGEVAFCLNAGKEMHTSSNYALESTIPVNNSWLIKAYEYATAEENVSNLTARIAAQTVAWYITQVSDNPATDDLKKAVCSAISSAKNSCSGTILGTCESAFEGIESMSGTSSIYTWKDSDGNDVQRILAKPSKNFKKKIIGGNVGIDVNANLETIFEQIPGDKDKNTTCEKTCELATDVNEASCGTSSFASTSSAGRIYQHAVGDDCEDGIDKENKITNDGKNIKEASDVVNDKYQIHCFSELNQEYPGNVTTPVSVGGYLVWPNNNINPEVIKAGLQAYPLKLRYSKICKMDVDSDTLKADFKKVKDKFDTIVSNYQNGKVEGVSSDNGTEGIKRFKDSSTTPSERNCTSLKSDTETAGKNYKACVDAGSTACEQQYGAAQDCSYKTGEKKTDCDANNATLASCKRGYENATGICNNDAHGKLYDIWNNYEQQFSACDGVVSNHERVMTQLNGWKDIIEISNKFTGVSVSDFNANIKVNYTLTPEKKEYNKEFILQKVQTETVPPSVDNSNTKTGLKIDPFEDNIRKFNEEVDDKSKEISDKTAKTYSTVWYDLNETTGKKDKLPNVNFSSVRKTSIKSIDNDKISDSDQKHITTIGFVNLPIPFGTNTGSEKLILTVESLSGADIDSEISNAVVNKKYTCSYSIVDEGPIPCNCPDNTENRGYNLLDIVSKEHITCSEAQTKYCDSTYPAKRKCPAGTKKAGFSLDSCIESGKSEQTCIDELCDIPNPNHVCPDGTANAGYSLDNCMNAGGSYNSCKNSLCDQDLKCPNADPDDPDDTMSLQFRDCISVKINQGSNLADAKAACDIYCNSKFKGQKIIYRTISLSDPFPSYDSDETVTQNNLTKGMFNDNIKGRYPGMNWNSTTTVKNKILNNRGVDGDKVYTKTPLYTFKLDAKTIQAIRKYNKKRKYTDFKLECKKGSAAACISTFVHSSTSGRTGTGTCDKTLTKKTFYTCDKGKGE